MFKIIIASLAFINIGKSRGFLKADECTFEKLLSEFFTESCAPGANDALHKTDRNLPDNLCSLCKATAIGRSALTQDENRDVVDNEENENKNIAQSEDDVFVENDNEDKTDAPEVHIAARALLPSCDANPNNRYFGSRGALQCLYESGDVAIVELQNLVNHAKTIGVDTKNFRVLCRNGTLAAYPGFDVDFDCALTSIVDGEIVTRRKDDAKTQGIRNALLSLDRYLLHDPSFRMYNIFNSAKDLLFQDSTLGLSTGQEINQSPSVKNYIKLFQDVDSCVQSTTSSGSTILMHFYAILFAVILLVFRI